MAFLNAKICSVEDILLLSILKGFGESGYTVTFGATLDCFASDFYESCERRVFFTLSALGSIDDRYEVLLKNICNFSGVLLAL